MTIRHAVAAAAVGCALGFTGIGIQAGIKKGSSNAELLERIDLILH